MSKAKEFIEKHNMQFDNIKIEEQMPAYLEEMQKGLDGEQSSLLMALSYVSLKEKVRLETPVVCIDAGGTNFRICIAKFDSKGDFVTEKMHKTTMLGVKKTITANDFFMQMAEILKPYCEISKEIVFSFAYPANPKEDLDGEITGMTKGVNVVGMEHKLLGKEIKACLEKIGVHDCSIIVINDSVATALSGKAQRLHDGFGAFVGTILGTGSNSCYMENIDNIGKYKGNSKGVMVINTESGSYTKLPRTDIDVQYDNSTLDPGKGVSEKMASGGYLGAICDFTLKRAYAEGVFAVADFAFEKITTLAVNEFLRNESGIIAQIFEREEDIQNAKEILTNIVLRGANIVALQIAAMVKKAYKTNNKVCVTMEGTTYEKMFGMKEQIHKVLFEYLEKEGLEVHLITVDQAVLKGCAIAALGR